MYMYIEDVTLRYMYLLTTLSMPDDLLFFKGYITSLISA